MAKKLGPIVATVLVSMFLQTLKCAEQLAQEYYSDPNTKEPLGTRDYLMTGTDQRIPQTPAYGKVMKLEFDASVPFTIPIGSGIWGPIQTSAFVSERPNPQKFDTEFCNVVSEQMSHHYTYSMGIGNGSRIIEYEAQQDLVFLFTADKSLACVKLINRDGIILSTQWVTSGLTTLIGDVFTGEAQNVGLGYEKDTGFLYVPSANGLFIVSQKDRSIKKVAEGVFQPFGDIVYTDCVKGVLVVAFRNQGVFAYDVSNPESIKLLAVFNASFFASQISNQATLKFTFFVIQSHLVQVAAESDKYKIPNDLIGNSLYNYTDILLRKDQSFELLVVSTNQGILFVDVSQMLGNARVAPTTPLPRKININNTVQLARFQNTLSILEQDPTQETPNEPVDSPNYRSGSTVTEILLTANDVSQWTNTAVASNLIFQINRAGVHCETSFAVRR